MTAQLIATEPVTEKCRLCKGRTKLQTLAGYDVLCWVCDGTGDEPAPPDPATCARCNGRQTWQAYAGAVEECPTCTAEDAPDPDACTRCDTVEDVPLSYAGLCRSCDYDEELQWGYIPSYLGVRTGPAA